MSTTRPTRKGGAKSANSTEKTLQEKIVDTNSPVIDSTSATTWLTANKFIDSPKDVTTLKLMSLLLEESLKPPSSPSFKLLIRAVAYLLETATSSLLSSTIVDRLDSLINTATSMLLDKFKTNIDLLDALATKCSELTSNSQMQADKISDAAAKIAKFAASSMTPNPTQPLSYRDAVTMSQAPNVKTAMDAKIANRLTIQARQLMFSPNKESRVDTDYPPVNATETLRKKAISALDQMTEAKTNNAGIRTVTALRNGNILLELTTAEGAEWLRKDLNVKDFLSRFAPEATIIRRNYPVILRFVLTSFTPKLSDSLRGLEIDWNLDPNSLVAASWVKNPIKRGSQQTVASVKLNCVDAKTANKILISTLRINGRQIAANKDVKVPSVCNKCQTYGHYARDCEATQDRCALCSGEHRTEACPNPNNLRCTPCDSEGHRTGDRLCPIYLKRLKAQDLKAPEFSKPFYPTDERWTWDDNEEVPYIPDHLPQLNFNMLKVKPTRSPQVHRGNKSKKRGLTQSTLTSSNFISLGTSTHRFPGRSKFPTGDTQKSPAAIGTSPSRSPDSTPRLSQLVLSPLLLSPSSPPNLSSLVHAETASPPSPQLATAPTPVSEPVQEPTTQHDW